MIWFCWYMESVKGGMGVGLYLLFLLFAGVRFALAGAIVPILRHLETSETTICLQGCLDVVFYGLRPNDGDGGPCVGDCGTVVADGMETNVFERYRVRLCPREGKYGVQIPMGAWHSVVVHDPSTIFEAKDGRYKALRI